MRTKSLIVLSTVVLLTACGGAPQAPVVDMEGRDVVTYNQDVAWCYKNQPFIAAGNPITACMKDKGYTILQGF